MSNNQSMLDALKKATATLEEFVTKNRTSSFIAEKEGMALCCSLCLLIKAMEDERHKNVLFHLRNSQTALYKLEVASVGNKDAQRLLVETGDVSKSFYGFETYWNFSQTLEEMAIDLVAFNENLHPDAISENKDKHKDLISMFESLIKGRGWKGR